MKQIETLLKEYENDNDLLYRVENYTHDTNLYICDTISEIADSETDIYYSNLIDWLKNDPDSVENIESAADEFGQPKKFDFMKLLQQGQYYGNEQKLYDNLNEIGKIWLLAYLRDNEKMTEITDEQADFIDELEIDNNDQFGEILDKWNEYNENNK